MTYDYIFAGAGAAGLSLVSMMSKDKFFDDKNILVIDSSSKNENDRTWCFWSEEAHQFKKISKYQWSTLSFKAEHVDQKSSIAPYHYYHLRGLDFYQSIKKEICKKDNITWSQDRIFDISTDKEFGYVKTERFAYKAKIVFNSIISLSTQEIPKPDLWQHFYGYTIRTQRPQFEVQTVTLMDFTLSKYQKEVQFGYILPFKEDEALVEFTEFSGRDLCDATYEAELETYLDDLGIMDYTIVEKEKGRIPMSIYSFQRQEGQIINIGTAGGMTKPTTGYTFNNIQKDSKNILQGLKSNTLEVKKRAVSRFGFYDRLLLGIIKDEPAVVQKIMSKLFKRNKMAHILKFLDEQTNILEEMRIFFSIPWKPFLKQLIKR